jgi:hypothetical protein
VERDERDVGARLAKLADERRAGVERDDLVAERAQRVLHPRSGAQRHLTLQ